MALAEKHLAESLVEWRAEQATGTGYVPIDDAINVAAEALAALQNTREQITHMAAATTPADRQVESGS